MNNIGNRRELFWDDFLVEKDRTTARLTLHSPQRKELAIDLDKPWEGDACGYLQSVKVGDVYRIYYGAGMIAHDGLPSSGSICLLESRDFVHWERPVLGLRQYDGSDRNNILMSWAAGDYEDNFFVFEDTCKACREEERFKAIGMRTDSTKAFPENMQLWCYTSPDGLRFRRGWKMTDGGVKNGGNFDTLNIAWWDEAKGRYVAYVRGFHGRDGRRDIRYIESPDFKTWSEPRLLDFGGQDDYPLYTSCVSRYYRAPHILVGFPTRYVCRDRWTKNFDLLGGDENARRRRERMKDDKRFGLATTDCVMMTSRDGLRWNRFDEAIFSPDLETEANWVYGDCYPMVGMAETPCDYGKGLSELSMYMCEGQWSGKSTRMYRYTIRIDGFASYRAAYDPCDLTTKPFCFEGKKLSINFSTSARGYVFVELQDEYGKPIEGYSSCEIFGNSLDRTVYFGDSCDVSDLAGKPVRLHFKMSDADVFSFVFK